MPKKETIIISLGGSLVVPEKIDTDFIKKFRDVILKYLPQKKFVICVGGGRICREYQNVLSEYGADNKAKDWIGIKISWLNAELIKNVFGKLAHSEIITEPNKKIKTQKDIIIGGGWKPGFSTDYDAVLLAKNFGADTLVNLSNIDHVCEKDPRINPEAKCLDQINWKDFRKIVGDEWIPGLSTPFDPKAAKLAEKLKLKVAVINGANLERFETFLNNKPFIGTIIS